MSKINKLEINTSLMPNGDISRLLTVVGKKNAEFNIVIFQVGTLKFYDFTTDTFTLGHAPKNNLILKLNSKTFRRRISFPSGSGTYVVKLLTMNNTTTNRGAPVLSKTIVKQGTPATITFTPANTTNPTINFQTFPTSTSTGNVSDGGSVNFDWTVKNASTDSGGFGLQLKSGFVLGEFALDESYYYIEAQEAIITNLAGSGEDSAQVTVSDLTGLVTGMELYYHKGTTTPRTKAGSVYDVGAVTIQSVDTTNKTIRFNNPVAFENGETMSFRAYGRRVIQNSTGVDMVFSLVHVNAPALETTLRSDASGTTLALTNTHGISGGNTIGYKGVGVNNSSSNKVTNVSVPDCPDLTDSNNLDGDGAIVVQLAQELSTGTVLLFENTYKEVNLIGSITINSYPETSMSVKLDLDKFLTVGTQA